MSFPPPSEGLARLDALLERIPAGAHADARLAASRFATMRFANGVIHQPHSESGWSVSLRVLRDGRLATATSTDLSRTGLRALVEDAVSLAAAAPREARFPGFPRDGASAPRAPYSAAVGRLTPERQARLAEEALDGARSRAPDARVSGVVTTSDEWLAVANTRGLRRSTVRSLCHASVLVERPQADPPVSGWSEGAEWDVRRFRPGDIGKEAAERMPDAPPAAIEPGTYRVLLGGSAVAELLLFLGLLAFGGHPEQEGWSCLRHRRGKRIAPESFGLWDDGRSSASLPQAIDFEGAPKRRTPLVDGGVAGEAVTDLVTAGRLGHKRSSGHALPPEAPWSEWGPSPTHQIVDAGDRSDEELVRETRRGVLVTRFWYVRIVHPGRAVLTGMTRDGTYRIERGELAGPVRNLRFTESALRCLAGIEAIGRERRRYSDGGLFCVTAPALLTRAFRFTSATLF
jgi:PmbA protein